MRITESRIETEQARRLIENFLAHVSHGKEWATPGVQAALQKVVTGLDTGVETASPRVQALLRRLAEDLAGGVETFTPRVQEGLRRALPRTDLEVLDLTPVETGKPGSRRWLWLAGLLAMVMAAAGAAAWRSSQTVAEEPQPRTADQETAGVDADIDPDLTSGRI